MSFTVLEKVTRNEYTHILSALARGVNPIDGTPLDDEGCWNHPVVIRALLFAADHLAALNDSVLPSRGKTGQDKIVRAGESWSSTEEAELRDGFERGESLTTLTDRHKRSRGAIIARLVHLGLTLDRVETRKIFASRSRVLRRTAEKL